MCVPDPGCLLRVGSGFFLEGPVKPNRIRNPGSKIAAHNDKLMCTYSYASKQCCGSGDKCEYVSQVLNIFRGFFVQNFKTHFSFKANSHTCEKNEHMSCRYDFFAFIRCCCKIHGLPDTEAIIMRIRILQRSRILLRIRIHNPYFQIYVSPSSDHCSSVYALNQGIERKEMKFNSV